MVESFVNYISVGIGYFLINICKITGLTGENIHHRSNKKYRAVVK